MQGTFSLELWYVPIIISLSFMYFFMQSLTLLGDAVSSNPLFEKRRLKHINKFTSFTTSILPVVITYYCILFCKNINTVSLYTLEVGSVYAYLPLFYVLVYVFLNICEKFFANKLGGLFGQTQHINTSGIFILVFIPVTTAMISAGSVLELLLPLEFLGLVFYFIFLEFNFIGTASSDKQGNKAVMRGLMYYFWLSFIGSFMFIVSILLYSSSLPLISYFFVSLLHTTSNSTNVYVLAAALVFIGLTLKMGGLFFFFFKADLYKYLPIYGVLLFSVYTSFFYLILLIYLTGVVPFFGVSFKYLVSSSLVGVTIFLLLSNNLSQKNVLTLAALSSVLTLCLCIFVIVI